MKILILGAGAVGGYFGARLHQSGMLRQPRVLIAFAEGKDGIIQDDALRR